MEACAACGPVSVVQEEMELQDLTVVSAMALSESQQNAAVAASTHRVVVDVVKV